jgi:LPS export ABC transporter protein LptC
LLAPWLFLSGCESGQESPPPPRPENLPDQVVENLVLRETREGRLRWILYARRALRYDKQPTELETVRLEFFDASGDSVTSVLTADGGTVDETTRDFVAQGHVVVVTSRGLRLETTLLRWDPKQEKVTTEAPVRILDGPNEITGEGLTSDVELRSYVIHRNVRGIVREEDGGSADDGR